MSIELIPAVEADRAFFRATHHAAYRDVIEAMFGWDEAKQDAYADSDFDQRNPHIILYNDDRAGVIGWQDKPDHLWFGPLFILPDYQGQGIGSKLVNDFIKRAQSHGKPLRLQTLRRNDGAKRLYEKLGFQVTETTDSHWQMQYP